MLTSGAFVVSIGILVILGATVFWWHRTPGMMEPEVGFLPREIIAETSGSDSVQRRFWIDVPNGGLARRFQGKVPNNASDQQRFSGKEKMPDRFDSTFIGIQYDPKTFDPTGWTVVSTQSPESPIIAYGSGAVTQLQ